MSEGRKVKQMSSLRSGRTKVIVAVVSATVASTMALAALTSAGPAIGATAATPVVRTSAAVHFRNHMRRLWEDHVWWTRLVIVDFAHGLPDRDPTVHRLLVNQVDIGNAVTPFYGADAGDHLTKLLKTHIRLAAAILVAAKSGDTAAFRDAKQAWYRNARRMARFLHSANPRHWRLSEIRTMMRRHLDLTLKEASDYLHGRYRVSISDFERVENEILRMADMLSIGIIKQFPAKFS
jgi:hypothetical protein